MRSDYFRIQNDLYRAQADVKSYFERIQELEQKLAEAEIELIFIKDSFGLDPTEKLPIIN